jgi:hypothetical protein
MSKSRRTAKSSRKPKVAKKLRKQRHPKREQPVSKTQTPSPDCPYRPGTLYGTLFTEGNKDYVEKGGLIKRVAELTGKSEKVVGFAFDVLKNKGHRSNKNRSTLLTEGDKIKLIAIRKG